MPNLEDTIAAISTPVGEGGIAIIRISGKKSFQVANAFVHSQKGRPSDWLTHTVHFAFACDNGTTLDQVMVTVMHSPRTYTGEDVVEISCHGGVLAARRLLDLTLKHGARLAEPGEFTQRAFLNGRIDLTQAEAVIDIIRSSSDRALSSAVLQLQGRLSKKLEPVRRALIEILAHVEAYIDFPDEDIAPDKRATLLEKCAAVEEILRKLLATAREGKILREGVRVTIVGRPNVGKSSLLNALLGEERAIVTPIPGTTRDTVEEVVNIRGIPIRLIDTAGLRHSTDHIEREGISRSKRAIELADIVIHMLDGSEPLTSEDREHQQLVSSKPHVTALNKSDLTVRINDSELADRPVLIRISATTRAGIEELKDALEKFVWGGNVSSKNPEVAINSRHENAIVRALESLTQAQNGFRTRCNLEFVTIDLRTALAAIGEITGHASTEDILDKIFSTFCIGK